MTSINRHVFEALILDICRRHPEGLRQKDILTRIIKAGFDHESVENFPVVLHKTVRHLVRSGELRFDEETQLAVAACGAVCA